MDTKITDLRVDKEVYRFKQLDTSEFFICHDTLYVKANSFHAPPSNAWNAVQFTTPSGKTASGPVTINQEEVVTPVKVEILIKE